MKFQRSIFTAIVMLASASAFAGDVRITVDRDSERLDSCGGSVSANNGGNGNQVNIVFRGLSDLCDSVVIKNIGQEKRTRLQCGRNGCSGSISLPARAMQDSGYNKVYVLAGGENGGRHDRVFVEFILNTPAPAPLPPPTHNYPSDGDSY